MKNNKIIGGGKFTDEIIAKINKILLHNAKALPNINKIYFITLKLLPKIGEMFGYIAVGIGWTMVVLILIALLKPYF